MESLIILTEAQRQRLERAAHIIGQPADDLFQSHLQNHISELLEEIEDIADALESMARIREGIDKPVPFREVMEAYGYSEEELRKLADEELSA